MRFPIDLSRLRFHVAAPAEPLQVYEEGRRREASSPRTDGAGEALWRVTLVAIGDGSRGRIHVTVPGDPMLTAGDRVTVHGLTAQTWRAGRRSGVSLRAHAITRSSGRSARASG